MRAPFMGDPRDKARDKVGGRLQAGRTSGGGEKVGSSAHNQVSPARTAASRVGDLSGAGRRQDCEEQSQAAQCPRNIPAWGKVTSIKF